MRIAELRSNKQADFVGVLCFLFALAVLASWRFKFWLLQLNQMTIGIIALDHVNVVVPKDLEDVAKHSMVSCWACTKYQNRWSCGRMAEPGTNSVRCSFICRQKLKTLQ